MREQRFTVSTDPDGKSYLFGRNHPEPESGYLTGGLELHLWPDEAVEALRSDLEELARLRSWKAEAIAELNLWHSMHEAIGSPGRLGQLKSDAVRELVAGLREEVMLLGEATAVAEAMQDTINDDRAFHVCPWCWPPYHPDLTDLVSPPFHFDEGCALMELLDLLTGVDQ